MQEMPSIVGHLIEGEGAKADSIMRQEDPDETALFFTLGSVATRAVTSRVQGTPVVAALVANLLDLQSAPNATAAIPDYSPEPHFSLMKRIIPG